MSDRTCNNSTRSGRGRGRGGFRPKRSALEAVVNNNNNKFDAVVDHDEDNCSIKFDPKLTPSVCHDSDHSQSTNYIKLDNAQVGADKKCDNNAPMENTQCGKLDCASQSNCENSYVSDDVSDFDDDRCDFCGAKEHRSRFCTIFNVKKPNASTISCYYCGKEGHIKVNCPKKLRDQARGNRAVRDMIKTYSYRSNKPTDEPKTNNGRQQQQTKSNGHRHIYVPMPVPASSIKPVVQLRSQLKSTVSTDTPSIKAEHEPKKKKDHFKANCSNALSYCSISSSSSFSSSSSLSSVFGVSSHNE